MAPAISVVVSTFNRSAKLAATIDAVLAQQGAATFELVVVDNNSSDGTAELVRERAATDSRLRYVFEPRQGVSFGRNAGIAAAGAPLLVFTDDDIVPAPDWLFQLARLAEKQPAHGMIGGCVLPRWPAPPPSWLTAEHWSPLALLAPDAAQELGLDNPRCLITANMLIRREVFEQIGAFSPEFQRVKSGIGSMEDFEIQDRYWRAGGRCWLDPAPVVYSPIDAERLRKRYHRRWHYGHGRFLARFRDPREEASRHKILGIPGHVLSRGVREAAATAASLARFDADAAFAHETRLLTHLGFIRNRLTDRTAR